MGSEMCIRDRPGTERSLVTTIVPPRVLCGHSAPTFTFEDQYECCLLYTSDAADERSSVDLGGRRIIKKKNITTTIDEAVPVQ